MDGVGWGVHSEFDFIILKHFIDSSLFLFFYIGLNNDLISFLLSSCQAPKIGLAIQYWLCFSFSSSLLSFLLLSIASVTALLSDSYDSLPSIHAQSG